MQSDIALSTREKKKKPFQLINGEKKSEKTNTACTHESNGVFFLSFISLIDSLYCIYEPNIKKREKKNNICDNSNKMVKIAHIFL